MDKEKIEQMFSCYGEKVVVTKKTVLVEEEDEAEDK